MTKRAENLTCTLAHSEFHSPVFPLTISKTVNLRLYLPLTTFHDVANENPNGKSLMLHAKENLS